MKAQTYVVLLRQTEQGFHEFHETTHVTHLIHSQKWIHSRGILPSYSQINECILTFVMIELIINHIF